MKIDVLEPVTEPTEWVNSFVVVAKVIDSLNAHSPHHSIKKSIRLCIDPKDLNEALEREPYYSRSIDELISVCRSKGVHHCRYGQGLLASSTTSRLEEIYLHGI